MANALPSPTPTDTGSTALRAWVPLPPLHDPDAATLRPAAMKTASSRCAAHRRSASLAGTTI